MKLPILATAIMAGLSLSANAGEFYIHGGLGYNNCEDATFAIGAVGYDFGAIRVEAFTVQMSHGHWESIGAFVDINRMSFGIRPITDSVVVQYNHPLGEHTDLVLEADFQVVTTEPIGDHVGLSLGLRRSW